MQKTPAGFHVRLRRARTMRAFSSHPGSAAATSSQKAASRRSYRSLCVRVLTNCQRNCHVAQTPGGEKKDSLGYFLLLPSTVEITKLGQKMSSCRVESSRVMASPQVASHTSRAFSARVSKRHEAGEVSCPTAMLGCRIQYVMVECHAMNDADKAPLGLQLRN